MCDHRSQRHINDGIEQERAIGGGGGVDRGREKGQGSNKAKADANPCQWNVIRHKKEGPRGNGFALIFPCNWKIRIDNTDLFINIYTMFRFRATSVIHSLTGILYQCILALIECNGSREWWAASEVVNINCLFAMHVLCGIQNSEIVCYANTCGITHELLHGLHSVHEGNVTGRIERASQLVRSHSDSASFAWQREFQFTNSTIRLRGIRVEKSNWI